VMPHGLLGNRSRDNQGKENTDRKTAHGLPL
jgi:hypothetical protein